MEFITIYIYIYLFSNLKYLFCFKICRLVGACILVIYLSVIYGTYVPDWQFTINNRESADYGKIFNVSTWFPKFHSAVLLS